MATRTECHRFRASPEAWSSPSPGIDMGIVAGGAGDPAACPEGQPCWNREIGLGEGHGMGDPAWVFGHIVTGEAEEVDVQDKVHRVRAVLTPDRPFDMALFASRLFYCNLLVRIAIYPLIATMTEEADGRAVARHAAAQQMRQGTGLLGTYRYGSASMTRKVAGQAGQPCPGERPAFRNRIPGGNFRQRVAHSGDLTRSVAALAEGNRVGPDQGSRFPIGVAGEAEGALTVRVEFHRGEQGSVITGFEPRGGVLAEVRVMAAGAGLRILEGIEACIMLRSHRPVAKLAELAPWRRDRDRLANLRFGDMTEGAGAIVTGMWRTPREAGTVAIAAKFLPGAECTGTLGARETAQ